MAITNVNKPSTAFINASRPSQGETWDSIQTTWAYDDELRTWINTAATVYNQEATLLQDTCTIADMVALNAEVWFTSSSYPVTIQSFTAQGGSLSSASFLLKRDLTPSGFVYAVLYEHSGTFGTSSVPTGAYLAISDPVDVSELRTGSFAGAFGFTRFNFSGSNRYPLVAGQKYCIGYMFAGTGSITTVLATGGAHSGNIAEYDGASWSAYSNRDMAFEVRTQNAITNFAKP